MRGSPLPAIARGALLLGALGSMALTLFQGRRNPSGLLMAMFAAWVALPFVALALLETRAEPGSARTRIQALSLALSVLSLALYLLLHLYPRARSPAAPYLLIPTGSLVVIAVAALVVRRGG